MMLRRFFQGDWILLSAAYLLLGVGLLTIYSLSNGFSHQNIFLRQSVFAVIGTLVLVSFPLFDYRHLSKLSTLLYFLTVGILVAVLFFGNTIRGTAGWVQFFGFQFQPVEFSKIVLIIFLGSFISQKRSELGDFVRLFVSFILTSLLIFLVLKQPDLGSALVLAGIWFGMVVVSGIRKRHIVILGVFFLGVAVTGWFFLMPYQKDRISTFLHPEQDRQGSGYNVLQSLVAVGSGGISGKGLGHGSQSQFQFLPERHTDFIYAVVSEELGFIGAALVLFLFGVFLWRAVGAALSSEDNFGYLLGMGFACMIFIQATVNIGMNIGVLPVTGIPLPLVSYGGSSLLSVFLGIAIIQNIVSRRKEYASHEWSSL
jgi:rod shape determining protein RodA